MATARATARATATARVSLQWAQGSSGGSDGAAASAGCVAAGNEGCTGVGPAASTFFTTAQPFSACDCALALTMSLATGRCHCLSPVFSFHQYSAPDALSTSLTHPVTSATAAGPVQETWPLCVFHQYGAPVASSVICFHGDGVGANACTLADGTGARGGGGGGTLKSGATRLDDAAGTTDGTVGVAGAASAAALEVG
eukprot:6205607-Pleurochrysis_carterae.AAC.2